MSKPEDLVGSADRLNEGTEIINTKIQDMFDWLGNLSLSQWLIIGLFALIIISIYFYYVYLNNQQSLSRKGRL